MKRSTGVVLVLMGTTAVGGTAAWVSSRNCSNMAPGTTQAEQCRSGTSYGSRYFWGSHGNSQSSSYTQNPSSKAVPATSPGVARSGFGSTSHGYSGS